MIIPLFREVLRHKIAASIFAVLFIVVGIVVNYLLSPTGLILDAIGSLWNILQNPAKLADEGVKIQSSVEGIFKTISFSITVGVEVMLLVFGFLFLFMMFLGRLVTEHDQKILAFDEKLEDFQGTLQDYENRGSAIIPYREKPKHAFFHAHIMDFYSREKYDNGLVYDESVDILNTARYQDLLLSPTYLEYLFRRRTHSNSPMKIVVVTIIDEGLNAYLALCNLAGYKVFIVSHCVFQTCVTKMVGECGEIAKEVLNGNPFFLMKRKEGDFSVTGKYEGLIDGEIRDCVIEAGAGKKMWPLLSKVIAHNADPLMETQYISEKRIETIVEAQTKSVVH